MKIVKEFREFILQGNALDLAVGVIIGAAFGAIVNSLVADVLMPPIGLLLGGVDFSNLYIRLDATARALPPGTPLVAAQEAGAVVLAYGQWLMTIVNFLIIAFFIFLLLKGLRSFRKPVEAVVASKVCPFCKTDIPLEAVRCPHCTSQL